MGKLLHPWTSSNPSIPQQLKSPATYLAAFDVDLDGVPELAVGFASGALEVCRGTISYPSLLGSHAVGGWLHLRGDIGTVPKQR